MDIGTVIHMSQEGQMDAWILGGQEEKKLVPDSFMSTRHKPESLGKGNCLHKISRQAWGVFS